MRLIDADDFDKMLENGEIRAINNQKYVFASALNTIRGDLRNAPTIEAVPVSYINHCIRETCGPESAYLGKLLKTWRCENE